MKLSDLHTFCTVASKDNLKLAAEHLCKTQPAVTQAIKRLEDTVGFQLFERDKYRLYLTAQGKRFFFEAERFLAHHQDLSMLAKEFSLGNEPKFNICYEPLAHTQDTDKLIANLVEAFSATEVTVTTGRRFSALEQVVKGTADIGIGPWFDLFLSTDDLESMAIGEMKLGLVAKKGLIPRALSFESLSEYKALVMQESDFDFDSERLAYRTTGSVMKLDDVATTKKFLLQGTGYSLVCLEQCEPELGQGLLERVRISDRQDEFIAKIHVFRKFARHHGPVARDIWEKFKIISKQYYDSKI